MNEFKCPTAPALENWDWFTDNWPLSAIVTYICFANKELGQALVNVFIIVNIGLGGQSYLNMSLHLIFTLHDLLLFAFLICPLD